MTPATQAPPAQAALLANQVAQAGQAAQHPLTFQRPQMNGSMVPGATTVSNSPRTISALGIKRAQSQALAQKMQEQKKANQAATLLPHILPLLMGHVANALVKQHAAVPSETQLPPYLGGGV